MIRGAKYEKDKNPGEEDMKMLNEIIDQMEKEFKELSDKVEELTQYSVVDIKRLVGVQLASGMIVADYVKNHK